MKPCSHDFDWSLAPVPWCDIGPKFRRQCVIIANSTPPGRRPELIEAYRSRTRTGQETLMAARQNETA